MTTRRRSSSLGLTDLLLGLLLIAAGAILLVGTYLNVLPTLVALGAFALVTGLVAIGGALVGRTSAGFFSEIISGAILAVLGLLILLAPSRPIATLALVTAALFLVNGLVRLAASTEYPSLRGVYLIGGAASVALGAAILSDAVKPSVVFLGAVVGIELLVDGLSALIIGRAEHPSRDSD